MRSSAACLTLLLTLSLVMPAVAIEQSDAYEIVSHGMFRDFHEAKVCGYIGYCECGLWDHCESHPTHTFTLDDRMAYLVFYVKVKNSDDAFSLRSEWRDPTGKVIFKFSWTFKIGMFVGDWKVDGQLPIPPHRALLGLYAVRVYQPVANGQRELFTEYFGLGHYPVFMNLEGLPQGQQVGYNVDGVESGRLETGNVSVTSFPISESHTISTPETVLSSNQEQFECMDCSQVVSEEGTLSFHYSRRVSVATTMTTSMTPQVTTAQTSTAIIPATVTVTTKESAPIDFAMLSIVMSVVAICVVAVLAFVVLRRRGNKS